MAGETELLGKLSSKRSLYKQSSLSQLCNTRAGTNTKFPFSSKKFYHPQRIWFSRQSDNTIRAHRENEYQ